MRNLKEELNKLLEWKVKSIDDISYVVLNNQLLELKKFLDVYDVEYNDSYSNTNKELNDTLKIIGKDFIIYVDDYDGAKSLSYLSIPSQEQLNSDDDKLEEKLIVDGSYHYDFDDDEDDDDDDEI